MKKKLIVLQEGTKYCGSAALLSIIRYYGGNISVNRIVELTNTTKEGTNFYNLKYAAIDVGLDAKAFKVDNIEELYKIRSPILCQLNIKGNLHFVVIYKIKDDIFTIMDPSQGKVTMDKWEFLDVWTGYIMIFEPIRKLPVTIDNKFLNKIIWTLLFKNKKLVLRILFLSIMFTLTSCIMTFYMQATIDFVIKTHINNLIVITIIFSLVLFIKNITYYLRDYLLIFLNQKIDISMIINTYTQLLLLPYNYYKNKPTGDIISRINDLVYVKNILNKIIITVLLDILIVIVGSIFLIKINKDLYLILVIVMIIYLFILKIFKPILKKYVCILQDNNSKINSFLVETISSFETIKGLSIEKHRKKIFEKLYTSSVYTTYKYNKIVILEVFLENIVTSIGLIIIMFLGTKYVSDGIISLSSFITFSSLLIYFVNPIKNIFSLNKEYYYAVNSIKRINNFFDVKVIDINTHDNLFINGNITFNNLIFSYNRLNNVIDNLSFKINNKEKVIILGSSGSGKSTILKILMKYYSVNRSTVFINNYDINDISLNTIKNNISYISQDEILYTGSIKDNIILNRSIDDKEFLKVTKITRVDEIINNSLLGYDMILEENGFNISGGQKQRIILARALLKKSNIILIDEGLNQIDINLERKILKDIFRVYKNKTIIIVSHRKENIDLYDKVIKISNGNLQEVITRNSGDICE